jgi:hypothetical protein
MKVKSNKKADKFRATGNSLFAKAQYCEALLTYNQSLCFSETGTEAVAFGYANRSAVYYQLKEFKLCLHNIELAKSYGYPRDKIHKLDQREVNCLKLLETYHAHPDSDPTTFFKMSYPASGKWPYLAECLELRVNKKFGRHIITTRDLKAGDIIALTEPAFFLFDERARLHHCSYCAKSSIKLSLIPCSLCTKG